MKKRHKIKRKKQIINPNPPKKRRIEKSNSLLSLVSSIKELNLPEHNINPKFASNIPKVRHSTKDVYLQYYAKCLIFRLLFDTRQLMLICDSSNRGEFINDKNLTMKTNQFQFELFKKIEDIIKESIDLPENISMTITKKNVDDMAKSLNDCLKNSMHVYYFKYSFLKLIHTCPNMKQIIRPFVFSEYQFNTLIYLLNHTMLGKRTLGIEGQIGNENKYNKIFDFIQEFTPKYLMNFGTLRTGDSVHYINPRMEMK